MKNNLNYITLIKLGIICCLDDKKESKEKIYLTIDLYLTELEKCLIFLVQKQKQYQSGYSKLIMIYIYVFIVKKNGSRH